MPGRKLSSERTRKSYGVSVMDWGKLDWDSSLCVRLPIPGMANAYLANTASSPLPANCLSFLGAPHSFLLLLSLRWYRSLNCHVFKLVMSLWASHTAKLNLAFFCYSFLCQFNLQTSQRNPEKLRTTFSSPAITKRMHLAQSSWVLNSQSSFEHISLNSTCSIHSQVTRWLSVFLKFES